MLRERERERGERERERERERKRERERERDLGRDSVADTGFIYDVYIDTVCLVVRLATIMDVSNFLPYSTKCDFECLIY